MWHAYEEEMEELLKGFALRVVKLAASS